MEKSTDEIKFISKVLQNSFLTKNLTNSEINVLADAMVLRTYHDGDLIITRGDYAAEYFILYKGEVEKQDFTDYPFVDSEP